MNSAFIAKKAIWLPSSLFVACLMVLCPGLVAQSPVETSLSATTVAGTVRGSLGEAIPDVSIALQRQGATSSSESHTDAQGRFAFSPVRAGAYVLAVKKQGWREQRSIPVNVAEGENRRIDLVLERISASDAEVKFDDRPNFTVAGVTDWNNVSIHGSDTSARTGEVLARETAALKTTGAARIDAGTEKILRDAVASTPAGFDENHRLGEFYCRAQRYADALPYLENAEKITPGDLENGYALSTAYLGVGNATRARETIQEVLKKGEYPDAHRLLGDAAEKLGDSLVAVREYERAVHLDPSELNYFAWGTELLLHRADQPAVEVFTRGSAAHSDSATLLEGLGAALSASGAYEEAARRICQAAELHSTDKTPYHFLGAIQKAATMPLPCAVPALERSVHDHPDDALANYYLAIALWKRARGGEPEGGSRAEKLLEMAVTINPEFGEAYLYLGIIRAAQGYFEDAIRDYQKAIDVSPQLGEAHYRLGLAYRRKGDESSAKRELNLYEQGEKMETAIIERQRRELRQFLIVLRDTNPFPLH